DLHQLGGVARAVAGICWRIRCAAVEPMHFPLDFFQGHLLAAGKGVLAVAPRAAQVASSQPHKDARQTGVGRFTLKRLVNLRDLHWNYIELMVHWGIQRLTKQKW